MTGDHAQTILLQLIPDFSRSWSAIGDPLPYNITHLLNEWRAGDSSALERLTPLVYEELRIRAARYLKRERQGHTLQTSALINEAYLRLIDAKDIPWQNRAHFFAIAANLMRLVLIDHARRRGAEKRGGNNFRLTLDDALAIAEATNVDLLALDKMLIKLANIDSRLARVVELRFFSGLSVEETALVMEPSAKTVKRDWSMARAWLRREIG